MSCSKSGSIFHTCKNCRTKWQALSLPGFIAGGGTRIAAVPNGISEGHAMKQLPSVLLMIGVGIAVNSSVQAQMNAATGTVGSKDPIELCEKLTGTEREICLRRARENPRSGKDAGAGATPGTGSTGSSAARGAPGAKPEHDKRGNTPPGTSRGGDAPASGAITDPAGVTKR
jgi:hypothetical protein